MFMIRFALNNPLLANLMVVLIVLAGLLSYSAMPQEMFPVVELDRVRITTVFKGASPE
ncbi:MAG: efflux RND transporter permease subunit, partial [Gammaproteobacteria bacterium]